MNRRGFCAAVCLAALAACSVTARAADLPVLEADVCVVGGGSGGIGASVAAARAGAKVVLVERQAKLGGTSARAYVSSWEPGPGSPLTRELYLALKKRNAVGLTADHNRNRKLGRFGLWMITPGLDYGETLYRAGHTRDDWHAVSFDPDALHEIVVQLLRETGNCRVLLETTFTRAETEGNRITAVRVVAADGAESIIRAKVFVDCTGGVHLCRSVGCDTMLGPEPQSRFGERSAPKKVDDPLQLNAISLCYRIRPSEHPAQAQPPDPPIEKFPHSAHVHQMPCGDLLVNPLGIIDGRERIEQGEEKTYEKARLIVRQHWHWLQQYPTFARYEFVHCAPMLGVRESWRVVGHYVLTQQDVQATLTGQKHTDLIALADHALDVHRPGGGGGTRELEGYYGVPYRCLVPKGPTNLLVACRGASFSQIAASSCRLSRTMTALGHAAGLAAAQAAARDIPVLDVDVRAIQKAVELPPEAIH